MVLHRAVTSSGLSHLRRSPFVQCGQAESGRKQWEHAADAEAVIAVGNDNDANDKETLGMTVTCTFWSIPVNPRRDWFIKWTV